MRFATFEECNDFYSKYGDAIGFGVKIRSTVYGFDGSTVSGATLACCKAGKPPTNPHDAFYGQKLTARSDCLARLRLRRMEDGTYLVVEFVSEHNHPLLHKDMLRFLMSKRNVSISRQKRIEINDRAGIGDSKTMASFVAEMGGHDNVPFTKQDVRNTLKRIRALRLGHGMSTTQRIESMNAFFDGYVNSKTTMKQFVEQYEMALKSKYEKEAQADFDSFHKKRHLKTHFFMEQQLSDVYTLPSSRNVQMSLQGCVIVILKSLTL
ncbi:Protein FAR-RED IMPAIRED RESPONSE 1 [Acorus calamus]|uniref:Protein FAR-RED IMPAIRED RESPONSE 1 n=1 Tax=Acorus calamus TaxID=4465 RepID=A0AAV9DMF7_ACOCL|nr:Protein FAR-RED IMPAIRED RESPONSE 1 [Acorus calamus]